MFYHHKKVGTKKCLFFLKNVLQFGSCAPNITDLADPDTVECSAVMQTADEHFQVSDILLPIAVNFLKSGS